MQLDALKHYTSWLGNETGALEKAIRVEKSSHENVEVLKQMATVSVNIGLSKRITLRL